MRSYISVLHQNGFEWSGSIFGSIGYSYKSVTHDWYPINQIMNTALKLIRRSLSLSDKKLHKKNLKLVTNILGNNSFPPKIVRRFVQKAKSKINGLPRDQSLNSPDGLQRKEFRKLTYVKEIEARIIEIGQRPIGI